MTTQGRTVGGGPIIIDLGCLGANTKGVARVLTALTPRLVALGRGRYRAVCSPAARPVLGELGLDQDAYVVPRVFGAVWEQVVLPGACTRLGASSVYSHGECGAIWGPRQLLHVPEDPEVRWRREPTTSIRELTRRRYSRLLMNRSLARANCGLHLGHFDRPGPEPPLGPRPGHGRPARGRSRSVPTLSRTSVGTVPLLHSGLVGRQGPDRVDPPRVRALSIGAWRYLPADRRGDPWGPRRMGSPSWSRSLVFRMQPPSGAG